MEQTLPMIALLAAGFLAMALSLTLESSKRNDIMRGAAVATGLIGTALYGYGYAWCYGLNAVSLLRALLALCRMFAGGSDLAAVQGAPLFQSVWVMALFWIGHFLGFYVMASAVVATLGDWLLRRIRVTRLRRGPLLLVYGVNTNSVAYARRMVSDKGFSALFVDPDGVSGYDNTVKSFGGIVERGGAALSPTTRFLKQINMKPGSRRMVLAALHADEQKNLDYSMAMTRALEAANVSPGQAALLIAGAGEPADALKPPDGRFGIVDAFDDYELTARLIVHTCPPCDMIQFDGRGGAAEDFHVVIVGFGRTGRAVFSQMFVNGQFFGSHFRADVFDPAPQNGFLHGKALAREYDVRFHPLDATTDGFYDFLEQMGGGVRCIALCTGSRQLNQEIASDLQDWYRDFDRPPVIMQAARDGFALTGADRRTTRSGNIYESALLDIDRMDAMAREVNNTYIAGGGSSAQNWARCDYESRMSSRASADFYPAVLKAAGKTQEQVLSGDWPPDPEVLERMAQTEHMRWCAYMLQTGVAPMPEEVLRQREEEYTRLRRQGDAAGYAILKDPKRRLHACLRPWEALDALSTRENAATGGRVDYKQLDRNNVLAVGKVLAAAKAASGGKPHA